MKLRYTTISLFLALLCLLTACGKGIKRNMDSSISAPITMSVMPTQKSAKSKRKPLFTGKFVAQADKVNKLVDKGDSAIQKMQVSQATITLGRFQTNHAVEAYLDEYGGGNLEISKAITLPGDIDGTHYRWKNSSNKNKTVMDAVVAESNGYSLLFLCNDPLDAFTGKDKLGPNEATVNGWVKNLTVKNNKAPNPMTAKGKKVTVKFNALKKKKQTIAVKSAYKVSKAQGKVSYKKTNGNRSITVAKTGKITVKKGVKKGIYKVKVKLTASGNANYKAGTKIVTVTLSVK